MNQKRIITEPVSLIRESARKAMRGRMGLLIASVIIYALCINVPVIIVEQIAGFWSVSERAIADYTALLNQPSYEELSEGINEWMQTYSSGIFLSPATFLFMVLVPGPLMLGISVIWLGVLRGKETYTDMVFSGFNNFLRATSLHIVRTLFMLLWAFLLIIPGIIAFYRYSLAFFLLADNPAMSPFTALTLSKYYMQGNKGNRFILDLSFIGWYILSFLVSLGITNAAVILGAGSSLFTQQLVAAVVNAIIFAPLSAYHGVAAAEYYHRVICRDPRSFADPPALPNN